MWCLCLSIDRPSFWYGTRISRHNLPRLVWKGCASSQGFWKTKCNTPRCCVKPDLSWSNWKNKRREIHLFRWVLSAYGPRWPEPNGTGNVVWSQQNQSSSPMRGKGHQGDSHRGDDGWLINRRWLAETKNAFLGFFQHKVFWDCLFFKEMHKKWTKLFVAKFGCSFFALNVLTI